MVWNNGDLVAATSAIVRANDQGFVVGAGVFETLQVVRGTAFALRRHLHRLRRSAEVIGLTLPEDSEMRSAVDAVLAANKPEAGRVRITVTPGPGPVGSRLGSGPANIVVAAAPTTSWDATADVAVVPWRRNEHSAVAGVKTTSYAENVVALRYAHERGASEAIFANTAGDLCEGTGSNVFVVVDGSVFTPPLSSGPLAGITRELVLELTGATEADIAIGDLPQVDEAFLTSSTRNVQPIASVDGTTLASTSGPHTEAAAERLQQIIAHDTDP